MIIFDQVAMQTRNIAERVAAYKEAGQLDWVQDTVDAIHIYKHKDLVNQLGEAFKVKLAFNYTVLPGVEFELLELLVGQSYQIMHPFQLLSHFGYHTKTDQAEQGPDSLLTELLKLQQAGFEVMQISQTTHHSGTGRRYRYAYVNPVLGAPVKIIQRLLPVKRDGIERSLLQGRELFACLG